MPMLPKFTPAQLGMRVWSVVDVVVRSTLLPRVQVPMVGNDCADYTKTIANHADYRFAFGELRDVKQLIFPLSGRFNGE